MRHWFLLPLLILLAAPATARDYSAENIPAPLQPWSRWVMRDYDPPLCAPAYNDPDSRHCEWPASLDMNVEARGGHFTLKGALDSKGWVRLPGGEGQWPQGVTLNGKPYPVLPKDGAPALYLSEAAQVEVKGSFAWQEMPETLSVPEDVAVVSLHMNGTSVTFPQRGEQGQIWLKRQDAAEATEADRLDLTVFRKIVDDIPLQMEVYVEMEVAGKSRESVIGPAVLPGFVPLSIESDLPARLENGMLRVKLRPGTHHVTLRLRHPEQIQELILAEPPEGAVWVNEEIWTLETRPALRVVEIQGPQAIDPSQTRLPEDWKSLPAYYLKGGTSFKLVEKRRGDDGASHDSLSMSRSWRLNFDGKGFAVQDTLHGIVRSSSRLSMAPGIEPGRVTINGAGQYITAMDEKAAPGVEVRRGPIRLEAQNRILSDARTLNATGWQTDVESLSGTLYLPPGWRLFAATGAHRANPSWIGGWTLLDLFLVLVTAVAAYKALGARAGAVLLSGLALLHPELPAFTVFVLLLLCIKPLLGVLPEGWLRKTAMVGKRLVLFALIVTVLPFAIFHLREAIYPQLGATLPGLGLVGAIGTGANVMNMAAPKPAAEPEMMMQEMDQSAARPSAAMAPPPPPPVPAMEGAADMMREEKALTKEYARKLKRMDRGGIASSLSPSQNYQYDPSINVQTGRGVATWDGKAVWLNWDGPVRQGQQFTLWLLSPSVNLALAFLRVGMIAVITLLLVGRLPEKLLPLSSWKRTAAAMLAIFLLLPGHAKAEIEAYPSQEMLKELKAYIQTAHEKKPECLPECAHISRLTLSNQGKQLTMTAELQLGESVAVPLPTPGNSAALLRVEADGAPAGKLKRDENGQLWIHLGKGVHTVVLQIALPENEAAQITLPLAPAYASAELSGWDVQGIAEDNTVEGSLRLVRQATSAAPSTPDAPEPVTQIPGFVRVTRSLQLGLTWTMQTQVQRISATGTAIALNVPLLAGESVTTAGILVKDGAARVLLAPEADTLSWSSRLSETDALTFTAPATADWVETWRVEALPLWHMQAEGLPETVPQEGALIPEWQPRPGETLTLRMVKPQGVEGPTRTLERSSLNVSLGGESAQTTLALSFRSSQASQLDVLLPETANVERVELANMVLPVKQQGRTVTLPISPGAQHFLIHWKDTQGVKLNTAAPEVTVGLPGVNAETQLTIPQDRWILFAGGPIMGPAVLFWSFVPLVLLLSVGAAAAKLTPLKVRHWFLLLMGMVQSGIFGTAIFAGLLLALGYRQRRAESGTLESTARWRFNIVQCLIAFWVILAVAALISGIESGLLGKPDMMIEGNGSYGHQLRWYQDNSGPTLPQPWVFSVPLWVYRGVMLAWALWLAFAVTGWARWSWKAFSAGGYWKSKKAVVA
ncbi:MAG: hypothetical protein J0L97_03415 [Alphaproteobacteria bacterium]|nr:hypothetical protein [Alphaproteobacteria bacterium]